MKIKLSLIATVLFSMTLVLSPVANASPVSSHSDISGQCVKVVSDNQIGPNGHQYTVRFKIENEESQGCENIGVRASLQCVSFGGKMPDSYTWVHGETRFSEGTATLSSTTGTCPNKFVPKEGGYTIFKDGEKLAFVQRFIIRYQR